MNKKQRDLICEFRKDCLDFSVNGDAASIANAAQEFTRDISKTDSKLSQMIKDVEDEFQNN